MLRKFLVAAASAAVLLSSAALAQSEPAPVQQPQDALTYQPRAFAPPGENATAAPTAVSAAAAEAVEPIRYQQSEPYGGQSSATAAATGARFTDWRAGLYGRGYVGVIVGGQAELDASGDTDTGPVIALASEDDLEVGWQAGYAIGLENVPLPNWRIEFEAFYADTETDDGVDFLDEITGEEVDLDSAEVTLYGGLVNALYDIDYSPLPGWRPFVGAGIGYGRLEAEYQDAEAEDEVFLWQLMAGAGYDFGDGRSVELSYRYLNADSADFDSDDDVTLNINGDVEVDQHALQVAYRYRWFR